MLAKLINDRQVRWKKMWRTLFVITIAIPQFVTLLLVGKMFGDYGIVNSICSKTGLTDLLRQIGLVGKRTFLYSVFDKTGMGACHDCADQYLGRGTVPDAECDRNTDEYSP